MAYTQEQLTTLQAAIALGANMVKYGDKTVIYNSLSDMLRAESIMKAELFPTLIPSRRKFAEFSKGLTPQSDTNEIY